MYSFVVVLSCWPTHGTYRSGQDAFWDIVVWDPTDLEQPHRTQDDPGHDPRGRREYSRQQQLPGKRFSGSHGLSSPSGQCRPGRYSQGVYVGEGLPPVPLKIAAKIQRGELVDMGKFLPEFWAPPQEDGLQNKSEAKTSFGTYISVLAPLPPKLQASSSHHCLWHHSYPVLCRVTTDSQMVWALFRHIPCNKSPWPGSVGATIRRWEGGAKSDPGRQGTPPPPPSRGSDQRNLSQRSTWPSTGPTLSVKIAPVQCLPGKRGCMEQSGLLLQVFSDTLPAQAASVFLTQGNIIVENDVSHWGW